MRSLLLIDVRTIDKRRVTALESRIDRVEDALPGLEHVLAAAHDSRNGSEMLLEKRRLASAG